MKRIEIFREAWRNFCSNTSRFFIFGTAAVLALSTGLIMQLSYTKSLIDNAFLFSEIGASTQVVEASERIDPQKCDFLGQTSGIIAAGAITKNLGSLTTAKLPDSPIPYYQISENFASLLAISDFNNQSSGALLSADVAGRLGVRPGDSIAMTDGKTLGVQAIYDYPDDGRDPALGYAVLTPDQPNSSQVFDQCWLNIWPQNLHLDGLVYQSVLNSDRSSQQDSWIGVADENPTVHSLNSTYGEIYGGYLVYRSDLIQYLPLAVLLVTLAIGLISAWSRRLQTAYLRHLGLSRFDLIKIQLAEALPIYFLLILVSVICSICFSFTFDLWDQVVFYTLALKHLIAALVGYAAGIIFANLKIDSKQFYNYFKSH
jgi:hypothetical protein